MGDISVTAPGFAKIASELASETIKKIASAAGDPGNGQMALQDLKVEIVHKAAELANAASNANIADLPGLQWEMARDMPDFELEGSYSSHLSAWSIAAAVLLGWVAGGVLSALLGIISLGGDVLRAGSIFAAIWLEEYLGANSEARNKLLKACGWMTLAGFATRLGSGVFRLASGWRPAIFGSVRPGIIRGAWLCVGVVFIFAFFAHRQGKPDYDRLRKILEHQIEQRLLCASQTFALLKSYADELERLGVSDSGGVCGRKDCALASGVLAILDSLEPNVKLFLTDKLNAMGYEPSGEDGVFAWDGEKHEALYETLGIIHDGDKCLVLKKPVARDGKITKGLAQRARP